MVFLDVVYNHFGPEGNYLARYAPAFFTDAHNALGQRRSIIACPRFAPSRRQCAALAAQLSFDGLRLDAVHAIAEPGEPSISEGYQPRCRDFGAASGRHIHLVLENDDNRAGLLDPPGAPHGKYRAQWNDDYHHAWHVILTGETHGYYEDYATIRAIFSREHSRRALPTRARPLLIAAGDRGEPRRPAPGRFRQLPSEPRSDRQPRAGRSARRRRRDANAIEAALAITLLAPCLHLCSWARNGERPRPSLSSAILKAISRMRYEQAGGENSPAPTKCSAMTCRIPWRCPHSKRRFLLARPRPAPTASCTRQAAIAGPPE